MKEQNIREIAVRFLKKEWTDVTDLEKRIVQKVAERSLVAKGPIDTTLDDRTFGQRLADRVASFGGSWTFIIIFGCLLLFWASMNTFVLAHYGDDFDPYPYILLNLFLSMLASIQAPIIMMSQNRQAAKDRLDATHDYEVNLKSEIEIISLHEKLDDLREQKWLDLVAMQQRQIELLEKLLSEKAD
ncbi:MAG: DUF1003 domain-containing protein [Acidobacteriota bacterium]|nr:MAG: DUF1003 domain-containing protein [Acidobacteriota bacterium]